MRAPPLPERDGSASTHTLGARDRVAELEPNPVMVPGCNAALDCMADQHGEIGALSVERQASRLGGRQVDQIADDTLDHHRAVRDPVQGVACEARDRMAELLLRNTRLGRNDGELIAQVRE